MGGKKVNLNEADEEALTQIEGIDAERARAIVRRRSASGSFQDWEDVARAEGVGPILLERLRAAATLAGAEEVEGEGAHDQPSDELVEALTGLAELDAEAALAYAIAADALEDEESKARLWEFRDDHRRHVRDLNEILHRAGAEPIDEEIEIEESLFGPLAEAAALIGDRGLVLAMTSNERLTNGTYLAACQLPCPPDVLAVIERNYADEQRHLEWLLQASARLGVEEPETAAEAP